VDDIGWDSTMLLLSLQKGLTTMIEESMKEKNSPPAPLTEAHKDPFVGQFKHIQMEKKSLSHLSLWSKGFSFGTPINKIHLDTNAHFSGAYKACPFSFSMEDRVFWRNTY
jgi:hypothetical protein